MNKTIFGIFDDRESARGAIEDLKNESFDSEKISLIMRQDEKTVVTDSDSNPVAEGALSGAGTGAVVGGLAGLLIGLGIFTIPGIGGLLIGGPLVAALGLGGAAATTAEGALTGALAGGLIGGLTGLGIPEERAREYESHIREGKVLIAVPTDEENEDSARSILEDNGASQIESVAGK